MKKILLVLMSLNSLGNSVSLENGEKYLGCDFNEKSREFICHEGDKTLYVKSNEYDQPYAIELDKKSKKVKVINVERMSTDQDEYFYFADPRYESDIMTSNQNFNGAMVDIGLSDKFIVGHQDDLLEGSEFSEEISKIINVAQDNINTLETTLKNEKLVIEVDGKDVDCEKDKNESCKILTCTDKKSKDTFYVHPRIAMDSTFIAVPSPKNKESKYYPEISKIKTKSGINLMSRTKGRDFDLYKATVPSQYINAPDLFNGEFLLGISASSKDVKSCSKLPADLFKNMQKKVEKDKAEAKMFSLVKSINGIFESILVNPESLPEIRCSYNGSFYEPDDYKKMSTALSSNQTTINLEMAQRLFDKARAREDIAWNYTYDGCYARAHLMAKMFEEEGVVVQKAWARGSLLIPNQGGATWGYHVAPAVDVQDKDGNIVKMIIDPSIASGPVTTQEWLSKMGVKSEKVINTSYPAPLNSATFNKVGLSYSSSEAYWPMYNEISEEDKMSISRSTMDEYLQYQ